MADTPPDDFNGWTPEQWQTITQQIVAKSMQDRDSAASYVRSMSGWIIGQLFIGNAGALTLLRGTVEKPELSLFFAGLVLSVLAAVSAWYHALKEYEVSDHYADARMLLGSRHFPEPDAAQDRARTRGFNGTIVLGVLSGLCFVVGGVLVLLAA